MADMNAIERIKSHADSLESVPHNKQFRADLYALCEAATPPADAALADDLFAHIAHGDDDHRDWLHRELRSWFATALRARAVPDDAVRAELHGILEYVEGEMQSAYHNAYPECCGRGRGGECCGSPEPAWSKEDQAIMDKLAPVQSRLHAMLAAILSATDSEVKK